MTYNVDYDLVLHIRGYLENLDHKPITPDDLLDDIFPGYCDCEFLGTTGYMNVEEVDDGEDDDEDGDGR